MPLSGAERQRKYIEKLKEQNPEKYEEKRKKHLEKVKQKQRKISDLIDSEKEARRQKWKEANDRRKEKKKQAEKLKKEEDIRRKREIYAAKRVLYLKAENAKLKQENKKLQEKLSKVMKRMVVMKKRIYRSKVCIEHLKVKNRNLVTATDNQPVQSSFPEKATPMSKASSFVEEIVVREEDKEKVKRKVFELNVISESLKQQYNNADTNNEKRVLKNVVNNDLVKKYSLTTKLTTTLGLKGRIRNDNTVKEAKEKDNIKKIKEFFLRDDVSRATAGRKECKTLKKDKQQKRFLLDSMKNLHAKYKSEGGKDSYTTFTRYRPFYVVNPTLNDRETCACVKHSNLILKAEKLKALKIIPSCEVTDLITEISCNPQSKECMYNTCLSCMSKSIPVSLEDNTNNMNITWLEWGLKNHEYIKILKTGERKPMTTKKVGKDIKSGTIGELIQEFNKELSVFKKHYYNIGHQHKALQNCIRNLSENEVVIICDFSENYAGKLHKEIQSVHFGGNRDQISLHTGVIYSKNNNPTSFCSVSPCCDHDPGAIWAHLSPVFEYAKQIVPSLEVVHMYSDGPATQYKQKKNFYLFSKNVEERTLDYASWSFFEASHGKGAADGVGGAVKRTLDDLVSRGTDIPNATIAFKMLKESEKKVKYFFISEEEIRKMQQKVPDDLIALPGTMRIHQIVTTAKQGCVLYRDLSCFCGPKKGCCECYEPKIHNLISTHKSDKAQNKSGKRKQFFKRINNKTSGYYSSDSDDYDSDDIPYADSDDSTYYDEDVMLEEIFDVEEIDINADSVENIEKMETEHIEENDLEINTIDKFDQILDNDMKKTKKEEKQKANEGQLYHTQLINSHAKELRIKTKGEVKMNVDEEPEMADDPKNDEMMIDLLNQKENSPPCASTCISKSCQVTKTPVKILTQEAVKIILNEKTGNMQIIPVKEDNDLKETKKEKQKSNERQIYNTQLLIDSHVKELRVETNDSGNLKTETDMKETKEEEKMNVEEEPEMADSAKMMIKLINQSPCASTSISNLTPEKILTQAAEKRILNERTGTRERVKEVETEPIVGNQGEFQDEKNETNKWEINNTVLVRYYIKKTWKYYIGTIEQIDNTNKKYKINYFKSIRQKGSLKFTRPRVTKDIDLVPRDCIVKHVELLQISKEHQEFVLANEEDAIFF